MEIMKSYQIGQVFRYRLLIYAIENSTIHLVVAVLYCKHNSIGPDLIKWPSEECLDIRIMLHTRCLQLCQN